MEVWQRRDCLRTSGLIKIQPRHLAIPLLGQRLDSFAATFPASSELRVNNANHSHNRRHESLAPSSYCPLIDRPRAILTFSS
jgi:hypothetical protein